MEALPEFYNHTGSVSRRNIQSYDGLMVELFICYAVFAYILVLTFMYGIYYKLGIPVTWDVCFIIPYFTAADRSNTKYPASGDQEGLVEKELVPNGAASVEDSKGELDNDPDRYRLI